MISVEEYLANPSVPESEYIDGVLRPRTLPTLLHSIISYVLIVMLRAQGVRAYAEVSIRPSKTRFLIPDLVADRQKIETPYPVKPVSLCIEILSPDDRLSSMLAKCEEFHEWGAPYCWVIDPVRQVAWEYHSTSVPAKIDRTGTLHAGDISVSMEELFTAVEAEL
jgi:Uma2 family endonuclease